MHIWNWTMKPAAGAITVDGKDTFGVDVKLTHIKIVNFERVIVTKPRRWWQKKPRRVVEKVFLHAEDKHGNNHYLHIIG
jgi:hypothetical protein